MLREIVEKKEYTDKKVENVFTFVGNNIVICNTSPKMSLFSSDLLPWALTILLGFVVPLGFFLLNRLSLRSVSKSSEPLWSLLATLQKDPTGTEFIKSFHKNCFPKEQKGIIRAFARSIQNDFGNCGNVDLQTAKLDLYEHSVYGRLIKANITAEFCRTVDEKEVIRLVKIDAAWIDNERSLFVSFVLTPADEGSPLDLGKHVQVQEIEPYAEAAVNALMGATKDPTKVMREYFHESLRNKVTEESLQKQIIMLRDQAQGWGKEGEGELDTTVNSCAYKDGVVVVACRTLGKERDVLTQLKVIFLGLTPSVLGFECQGTVPHKKIHIVEC